MDEVTVAFIVLLVFLFFVGCVGIWGITKPHTFTVELEEE